MNFYTYIIVVAIIAAIVACCCTFAFRLRANRRLQRHQREEERLEQERINEQLQNVFITPPIYYENDANNRPIMPASVLINEEAHPSSHGEPYSPSRADGHGGAPPPDYAQYFPQARVGRINEVLSRTMNQNNTASTASGAAPVQGQILHAYPSPTDVYGEATYLSSPPPAEVEGKGGKKTRKKDKEKKKEKEKELELEKDKDGEVLAFFPDSASDNQKDSDEDSNPKKGKK